MTTAPGVTGNDIREIIPFFCFRAQNVRRLLLDCPPDRRILGVTTTSRLLCCHYFKNLEVLRYSSQDDGEMHLCDVDFIAGNLKDNHSLRELHLNHCSLQKSSELWDWDRETNPISNYPFLSEVQDQLVRVSCKGVHTLRSKIPFWSNIDELYRNEFISQDDLMHFVRNAPKLWWFESNLTCDNIRILQQERPEVVFVS